jgi:hypothetical protein
MIHLTDKNWAVVMATMFAVAGLLTYLALTQSWWPSWLWPYR